MVIREVNVEEGGAGCLGSRGDGAVCSEGARTAAIFCQENLNALLGHLWFCVVNGGEVMEALLCWEG